MSIIDDDSELDRILENTNFDDYTLFDIPMEPDESLHALTGVGMAPTSDTPSRSGLAPRNGSSSEMRVGVDQEKTPGKGQGSFLSSPLFISAKIRSGRRLCTLRNSLL